MKTINLEEIKRIQVNILKYVDEVCSKNNIKYFLISGTLLGAIRHNGFIPWDDDIDIALTTDDYNKLKKVLISNNNIKDNNYIAFDNSSQKDYYYPFMKISDKRTKLIENNQRQIENYGVHIDIFEYTPTSDDEQKRKKQFKQLKKYKKYVYYYSCEKYLKKNIIKKFVTFMYIRLIRIIGIKKILNKYNKIHHKYTLENGKYLLSNWPSYDMEHELQETDKFKNTTTHQFENIEAKIPEEYDEILTRQYRNYMELPPEEKRVTNHDREVYWR